MRIVSLTLICRAGSCSQRSSDAFLYLASSAPRIENASLTAQTVQGFVNFTQNVGLR